MFLLLALIGCPTSTTPDPVCESGDEFPTCEVADACREADTATRADCEQRLSWSDACSADWRSSAGGATQTGLVYAGYFPDTPYSHAASFTITDAATWEELLAGIDGAACGSPPAGRSTPPRCTRSGRTRRAPAPASAT